MNQQNVVVASRSTKQIEELALAVRQALGYNDDEKVDMLELLEHRLVGYIEEFEFDVESDSALGGADALTSLTELRITVSQSCYDQAYHRTSKRPQFTLAHELGHLVMHQGRTVSLARGKVKAYQSPEWQADTFAASFLAPADAVRRCNSVEEVSSRFSISREAARLRILKVGGPQQLAAFTNKRGADL